MLIIAQLKGFFVPRCCSIWWTLMPHTASTCQPRSFACPGMSSKFNSSLQRRRFFQALSVSEVSHTCVTRFAFASLYRSPWNCLFCSRTALNSKINCNGRRPIWLFPVPYQSPSWLVFILWWIVWNRPPWTFKVFVFSVPRGFYMVEISIELSFVYT